MLLLFLNFVLVEPISYAFQAYHVLLMLFIWYSSSFTTLHTCVTLMLYLIPACSVLFPYTCYILTPWEGKQHCVWSINVDVQQAETPIMCYIRIGYQLQRSNVLQLSLCSLPKPWDIGIYGVINEIVTCCTYHFIQDLGLVSPWCMHDTCWLA